MYYNKNVIGMCYYKDILYWQKSKWYFFFIFFFVCVCFLLIVIELHHNVSMLSRLQPRDPTTREISKSLICFRLRKTYPRILNSSCTDPPGQLRVIHVLPTLKSF